MRFFNFNFRLLLVLAAIVSAIDAASVRAQVVLDVTNASVAPSGGSFFIDLTLTNNSGATVTFDAFDVKLNFTPSFAPSELSFNGISLNPGLPGVQQSVGGVITNPTAPSFVAVNLIAIGSGASVVSVPNASFATLARFNFTLGTASAPFTHLVSLAGPSSPSPIIESGGDAVAFTTDTGVINTPEPGVATVVLTALVFCARSRMNRR